MEWAESPGSETPLDRALAALGIESGSSVRPAPFSFTMPPTEPIGSRWPVSTIVAASVVVAVTAAASYESARRRAPVRTSRLDLDHAMALFASERHLRVGGRPLPAADPVTGDYRARDGRWVRIHANFPSHRRNAFAAFGLDVGEGHGALSEAIAAVEAQDVEQRVVEAGGCAAMLRITEEWSMHPQGRAVEALPLVETLMGDGRVASFGGPTVGAAPLAGVRVLDLSRVIAGPVAGRVLANFGAEVLRVGAAGLPQVPQLWVDTGFGKRTVRADITTPNGARLVRDLAASADVVVQAYRPGALERYGLGPAQVMERNHGVVYVNLSAWGSAGPWSNRRGFDSLVQMATGLAQPERGASDRPHPLPLQLLDHATGWLAAAAAVHGLKGRLDHGRGSEVGVSLAQTAHWLLHATPLPPGDPSTVDAQRFLTQTPSVFGNVTHVSPLTPWTGLSVSMSPPTDITDRTTSWTARTGRGEG